MERLWQAVDGPRANPTGPWEGTPMPGLLTAQQLRAAARKFKATTSAPDGLSPRQIAHLSENALEALAQLIQAFEYGRGFRAILALHVGSAASQAARRPPPDWPIPCHIQGLGTRKAPRR